ncbi:uncharacterized protein LOC111399992 [Olea europaea var. sylvestris]|uniref:uncharacterized protein LOC111399992 n=1 Tax=Olea europaea var. sylvestris TaxID=158386 RepID=UPI000C1CD65A|nr:uncharacterized protein LOC111399992 [Olea europaea var. sylvestris]
MHKFQDPRIIYRPSDIINDVRREYGVVMSYQKAWKAKECAFCYNMGRFNTESTFFIEKNDENHFKYFIMALGQCVRGFRNAMRPLILVDGTTLKARYGGKLIIVTCQNANIQIYPLAFGIVDGENDLAVRWFFTKLREVIGDVENLAFVIDRGQSIINGIAEVFPEAHHGYCMYHIQENLKTKYQGKGIVTLFRRAAEAYDFQEFEKFMVEIESKSYDAWEYLTEMGIEHWWFHDRRKESQSYTSVLTPAQENKLFKTLEVARKVYVEPLDQFRFSARYALAVAMYRGIPSHTIYSAYYTTGSWRAAYAETIFLVPNEAEWEVPDHILSLNNLLPAAVGPHTPGRTRTSRIPSIEEFLRPRKCGGCGVT